MDFSKDLLPAYASGCLELAPGQTVDLGTNLVELVDDLPGSHRSTLFLLTVWVKLPETRERTIVVSQEGAFRMGFENLVPFVEIAGIEALRCHDNLVGDHGPLRAGRWIHLAVANEQESITMYVNGQIAARLDAKPAGSSSYSTSDNHVVVGDPLSKVEILEVAGWRSSAGATWSQEDVNNVRFKENDTLPGLVFSWEFMECPASNVGPAGPQLTYHAGAHQTLRSPGLRLGSSGSATCPLPRQTGGEPFTIQTWVHFPKDGPGGLILSREGQAPGNGWLLWHAPGRGLFARFGGQEASCPDPLEGWHNIAVVGRPGFGISLFVDGNQFSGAASAAEALPLADSLQIGGTSRDLEVPGFQGLVQEVILWSQLLSKEQILYHTLPDREMSPSPQAVVQFAFHRAQELVEGESVSLQGDAILDWNPVAVPPQFRPLVEEGNRPRRFDDDESDLDSYQPHPMEPSHRQLFSPERESEALKSIGGIASSTKLHPLQASKLHDQLRESIQRQFQAAREGRTVPGMLFTQTHGDKRVTFLHTRQDGIVALAATPTNGIDPCTEWKITFTMTVIFELMSILDVPVTPKSIRRIIKKLFRNSKLKRALAKVVVDHVTAATITATLKAFYDADLLSTLASEILDSLSFWDALWLCVELIMELGVLVLAPELEALWFGAKVAKSVATVALEAKKRPEGCAWSS